MNTGGADMVRISKSAEERKNEIMDIAWRFFIEKGFENTAVSDIVKAVGVAQGTFYYYFKTKEDILNAILERMLESITLKLKEITSLEGLSSIEKLRTVIGFVATIDLGNEDLAKYIHEDKNIVMHHKLEAKFSEQFVPILTDIVKQGLKEGIFNTPYPEEAVKILFAGLGAYLHYEIVVSKDKNKLLEAMEVTQDITERVLGAKKGSIKLF
jgi:AcrR family transcriptional regulator